MMSTQKVSVQELLSAEPSEITTCLAGIYENSPWVPNILVENLNVATGISTVTQLAAELKSVVTNAATSTKLSLLCEYSDSIDWPGLEGDFTGSLAGGNDDSGTMAKERCSSLKSCYLDKFGFPFILTSENLTINTVLAALEGRLQNSPEKELDVSLDQIHKLAWLRLLRMVDTSDSKGFLTCHVLDTAHGCPASNMHIRLKRLSPPEDATVIGDFITNEDGRTGPALYGPNFIVGTYEWTFFVGDYFASKGVCTSARPFLDEIPIRFGIDNPDEHYHVPLLVSPWSYSTYRGS